LPGVVRDFDEDHPDMEPCDDRGVVCSSERGLVQSLLGGDGKPRLTSEPRRASTTVKDAESFNQWFNDVEGVNTGSPFALNITRQRFRAPVVIGYDSANPPPGSPDGFEVNPRGFFPIDAANTSTRPHNYHFTYEVVTAIRYTGGETLTVRGDDDIFVFLNRHLVIDLGGIHSQEERTIQFDELAPELGLSPGNVYDFRLFFAERHVEHSNLFLSTTARFMSCTGPAE
jgi:fibro-slime domain-containing protein